MSSIEPWFFDNLSLKHLAIVKSVEVLWKQSKVADDVKESFNNFLQESDTLKISMTPLRNLMSQKFDSFVANLGLPTTMKNDLSLFSWQMYQPIFDLLECKLKHDLKKTDPRWTQERAQEALNFVDTVVWDSIGLIDVKKMLESSVRDKEAIDYSTWAELCYFYSEDDIRHFSGTVDWKKKYSYSTTTIYWYYQIYGTFPTEGMFALSRNFDDFRNQRDAGLYGNDKVNHTLFRDSNRLSAVKYFWSRLTDSQKLELSAEENVFNVKYDDSIAIYLLGEMKFNYSPAEFTNRDPWQYLLQWPWVLFIDSWIDKHSNMNKNQFVNVFLRLKSLFNLELVKEGTEEFTRRQNRGHLHAKYYGPLEKLWPLCLERFGSMDETSLAIAALMFNSENITFCQMVMKDIVDDWRKVWLRDIGVYCRDISQIIPSQDFCDKFMKEVLADEEERDIFQRSIRAVSEHR